MQLKWRSRVINKVTSAWNQLMRRASLPGSAPVGAALLVFVVLIRHLSIHIFFLIHLSAVTIALVLLLPEVLARLADRPEFAGQVFAWRTSVIGTLLVANLTFAMLLAVVYHPWRADAFTVETVAAALVQGALVGGFIRELFVKYLEKAVRGISTDAVETMLLLSVATYLFLFPSSDNRYMLAAPYLAGISGGFVAHFALRGFAQQTAREARRRRHMLDILAGPKAPKLQPRESAAVEDYIHERFGKLRKCFKQHKGSMTTPLLIVQCAMERFLGNYREALRVADEALKTCDPMDELISYLHLQKALCLGELGIKPLEMYRELRLVRGRAGPCMLARITFALRMAEGVPFGARDARSLRRLRRAHMYALQAMASAERNEDCTLWGMVEGMSVPVTWTFMLDAYAYVALRSGHTTLSKALLEQCINLDPKFSSPYLHLGERYLMLASEGERNDDVATHNKRLARLCLNIAIALECKREGLIKRRAQDLLDTYFVKLPVRSFSSEKEPRLGRRL